METPEDRFFRELGGACSEMRQAFAQRVGMSEARLRILMRLWNNGETSHSDLRRTLSLDGAGVTRLIKEFETEGLVARRLDPADNRYTLARLTPAGERVAAGLAQAHQAFQVQLLDGVPRRDQEIVVGALQRLRANMTDGKTG